MEWGTRTDTVVIVESRLSKLVLKGIRYLRIAAFCCNTTMKAGKTLASSQENPAAWHLVTSYSVMKLVGPTGKTLYYTGQVQVGQ
jgi:hypothetical protein